MKQKVLFERIYAEATAIPYDSTRIESTRSAVYQLANLYNIPVKTLVKNVRLNKANTKAGAEAFLEQDIFDRSVSVMGTLGLLLSRLASHVHGDVYDTNMPQFAQDLLEMLQILALLDYIKES